ncbi:MAG: hypothetical protein JST16_09895 [Bdellovibrionales bacterium]|nr:hypothetical protein [Bdellovibrionales bacterium]
MKKFLLLFLMFAVSPVAFAKAKKSESALTAKDDDSEGLFESHHKPKEFGLGLVVGDPTGVEARYNLSERNSVHAALSFLAHYISFFGDFVWNFPRSHVFAGQYRDQFTPYVGGGLIVGRDLGFGYAYDEHGTGVAMRAPVGINWTPKPMPDFNFFFELAPGVAVVDGSLWGLFGAALGGVYCF